MSNLPEITTNNNKQVVSAKELYDYLGYSNSQWARWYNKNIIKDDLFEENTDYQTFDLESNGNPTKDFALTVDMAKELSMLARTKKGKIARKYFIECEKKLKSQFQLPKTYSEALRQLADTHEENTNLKLEIDIKHKPRSQFVDQVFNSDNLISMSIVAKTLGLKFGRNTLYRKLREKGILFKNTNEPKQTYVDRGYFKIKEKLIIKDEGKSFINIQTFVTQKGLAFIAKTFNVVQVPVQPLQISA